MLYVLGGLLAPIYGPFRLLRSHLFLAVVGLLACWYLSWRLLPVLARLLPSDRGKQYAVGGEHAKGKPTGAGLFFVTIYLLVLAVVVPPEPKFLLAMACILAAMLFGFFDDRAVHPWSEYTKGFIDLVLSIVAAVTLWVFQFREVPIWLPLTKHFFYVGPLPFIAAATALIWLVINAVNCTDGIDGLSGSLSILALVSLGLLLAFVLGHAVFADYFLLPRYKDGARWAIMAFAMVGSLFGYLWHNAYPSALLMGDAGSRAIGLLIGILIIATGNPFVILTVATVVLVNGGTGLIKVALLRFFRIGILHDIRFPLHDHFRHKWGWSNTQVLIRFAIAQALLTIVLFIVLVKIR
jgi:phospho-N-acetylmuramoyl-pentapeptide-transferase